MMGLKVNRAETEPVVMTETLDQKGQEELREKTEIKETRVDLEEKEVKAREEKKEKEAN